MVRAAVHDIVQTFEGVVAAGQSDTAVQDYVLMVAAARKRRPRWPGGCAEHPPGRVVLIVGDRDNIQSLAIDAGVRALIVTGGLPVPRDVQTRAEQSRRDGDPLAVRHGDDRAAGARGGARGANDRAGVRQLRGGACRWKRRARKGGMLASGFRHLPGARRRPAAGLGVLTKSDFLKSVPRQLILVDHNELSPRPSTVRTACRSSR